MDQNDGGTTTVDEPTEQVQNQPPTAEEREEAARKALERAGRPPEALGGPPDEDDPTAAAGAEVAASKQHAQPGADEAFARSIAQTRADGADVEVVGDAYVDSRDAVANGEGDEFDLAAVQEWLLSDEAEVNTRMLRVRLGGSDDQPIIAPWYIKAIGVDTIRSAEREASGANRQQRRGAQPQYDELKATLRIVVEGTVAIGSPDAPDLKALARGKQLSDPVIFLQRKFAFRPGVIAQIAGEVMALSGFDQEDVRAAGN
jgi:hypothetical protein